MIATALTELFKLAYPILLASMGGVSAGHLATRQIEERSMR